MQKSFFSKFLPLFIFNILRNWSFACQNKRAIASVPVKFKLFDFKRVVLAGTKNIRAKLSFQYLKGVPSNSGCQFL